MGSTNERVIYSINVADLQEVASDVLHRKLTKDEIALLEGTVGDYIDWFDAIESAIHSTIR